MPPLEQAVPAPMQVRLAVSQHAPFEHESLAQQG
jgi:hypothetical protein